MVSQFSISRLVLQVQEYFFPYFSSFFDFVLSFAHFQAHCFFLLGPLALGYLFFFYLSFGFLSVGSI